ncbi:MAG: permease-like cell division protein FtsX [Burkholderiales bacterium]
MSAWLNQHFHALQVAWRRLWSRPLGAFMTIALIALMTSLPTFAHVVVNNVAAMLGQLNPEPKLSVYLKTTAGDVEVSAIENKLHHASQVASFRFVSKEAALKELESAGIGDAVSTLEKNPLPHAFVILPKTTEPNALALLEKELRGWPEVEHVSLDSDWARKLSAMITFAKRSVLFLTGILGIALVFVMANTIRLQILNQREEIDVTRLIGATPAFIRRPFLYFGIMQALLGGLLGLALVALGIYALNRAIEPFTQLYAGEFLFRGLNLELSIGVIATLILLAVVSTSLAVTRSLRQLSQLS